VISDNALPILIDTQVHIPSKIAVLAQYLGRPDSEEKSRSSFSGANEGLRYMIRTSNAVVEDVFSLTDACLLVSTEMEDVDFDRRRLQHGLLVVFDHVKAFSKR
jgi:hypothetical protein